MCCPAGRATRLTAVRRADVTGFAGDSAMGCSSHDRPCNLISQAEEREIEREPGKRFNLSGVGSVLGSRCGTPPRAPIFWCESTASGLPHPPADLEA
jgi:hypothetical protein